MGRSVASLATSSHLFAEPSQTICFLDWDDTLFPTTALFEGWGLPNEPEAWADLSLSQEQRSSMEVYRQALVAYLQHIGSLAEALVIVTNARRPWVHQCVDAFVPEVRDFLQAGSVRIVYAREAKGISKRGRQPRPVRYEAHSTYGMTPLERQEFFVSTKTAAMRRELRRFYSAYPGQTWKNVISYGDAGYEQKALEEVAFTRVAPPRERLRLKALRSVMPESVDHLAWLLLVCCVGSRPVVHHDGDLIANFEAMPRETYMDQFLEMIGLPPLNEGDRRDEAYLNELVVHIQSLYD